MFFEERFPETRVACQNQNQIKLPRDNLIEVNKTTSKYGHDLELPAETRHPGPDQTISEDKLRSSFITDWQIFSIGGET
jgi:hypothetical protein